MILEAFNFLHFLGLAFGLGGATIATIISVKAGKDKDVEKAVMKIIPSISKLIWFGLILLVISGIGISFYVNWPINKNLLIIKHIFVAWIFVFGVVIGFKVRKMSKFILLKDKEGLMKNKKQMKILSMINLVLWYLVTLMSVFI